MVKEYAKTKQNTCWVLYYSLGFRKSFILMHQGHYPNYSNYDYIIENSFS